MHDTASVYKCATICPVLANITCGPYDPSRDESVIRRIIDGLISIPTSRDRSALNRETYRESAHMGRLAQGLPVAALGVRCSRTAEIARIARSTGHQAIWIDMEHSTMPVDTFAMICAPLSPRPRPWCASFADWRGIYKGSSARRIMAEPWVSLLSAY